MDEDDRPGSDSSSSQLNQDHHEVNGRESLIKRKRLFFDFKNSRNEPYQPLNIGSLIRTANNYLASNQLDKVNVLMPSLINDQRTPHRFLFSTLMILHKHHCSLKRSFHSFISFIEDGLKLNVDKREALLECIVYLLTEGQCVIAREIIDKNEHYIHQTKYSRDHRINTILHCYNAYIDHLKWANAVSIHDRFKYDDDIKNLFNKSRYTFKEALSKPGQWDLFAVKLVEMLEVYEEYDEIIECLNLYRKSNKKNINAHHYAFTFLSKNKPDDPKLLRHCLYKILDISPSDLVLLTAVEQNLFSSVEAIQRLMYFIDFKENQLNIRAWHLLSTSLQTLNNAETLIVQDFYKNHFKHWHKYMFNANLDNSIPLEIRRHKTDILKHLEYPSHPYIETTLTLLNEFKSKCVDC